MDSLKSKIMGFVKPVTMAATAVGMSMMGAVTAFASVPFTTSNLTPESVSATNLTAGGTGLLAFLAYLVQTHILLLFGLVAISMGVGFIIHVIVGSIFRSRRG